jgi:hypothetical protein
LIFYCTGFLNRAGLALTYPLALDYGEGFLLGHALDIANGESPYQPLRAERLVVCNYPPLYPAVSSLFFLMQPEHPAAPGYVSVFAGPRVISILSTLGVALLAMLFLLNRGVQKHWAVLAALLYLSLFHVFEWGVLARVDCLALFFSALGLYLFERKGSLPLALLCFSLAFLTRQTFLAGLLSVSYVLWKQYDRKKALSFLLGFVAIHAALIGVLSMLTHGAYFTNLFAYNSNELQFNNLITLFAHMVRQHGCMLTLALVWVLWSYRRRRIDMLMPLFILTAISTLAFVKVGSGSNYFLEFMWVVCIIACQFIDELDKQSDKTPVLSYIVCVLLFMQTLQFYHVPFTSHDYLTTDRYTTEKRRATGMAMHFIREAQQEGKDTIASDASFHVLAGVRPPLQPFIMRQLFKLNTWDKEQLYSRMRDDQIRYVILDFDPRTSADAGFLFSQDFYDTLARHYKPYRREGQITVWRHGGRR